MISNANLPYILAMLLMGVGIYAIACKKNLVKIIIGIIVMEYAVNLFLLLQGYRTGGKAPILGEGESVATFSGEAVDPLPQAMILTSIVIGLALVALMVSLAIRIYEKYGTFDLSKIRKLRG